ncbi:hypothetical protein [Paenibacillus sp. FSL R5-0701]|uniref:hypothetical protein n=1 Tax=Paenibacillus sp. FSL R5-0701 TaxID=2921654 RepID=UPI0030D107A5
MGIQDVAPAFRNPPTFQDLEEVKSYLKDNINKIARSLQDIDFMINGTLDVNNIRAEGIEARSIKAEAITTEKLQAGSITTEKIQAGAVVADKIDVGELSAISANLGHIVAGLIESVEIYGSYISTNKTGYPKAEMSNTNNLFGAYIDANNFVRVLSDDSGVPSFVFVHGGAVKARFSTLLGTLLLDGIGGMEINVTGGNLTLPRFTDILSSDGYNLGVELDEKAVAGISTGASGAHNHGIPDGTQFKDVNGVTWTYRVAGTHTHEQTS